MEGSGGLEVPEGYLDLIVAYCACVKYTTATNKYNYYHFNYKCFGLKEARRA